MLTTYEGLRRGRELLLPVRWGAAVLDEGHKIRNPDADVTLAAKRLRTVHRLVLSGSPIQNRLQVCGGDDVWWEGGGGAECVIECDDV